MVLPILLSGITFIFLLKKNYFLFLNYPIDFGLSIGKKRIFGENKKIKGPIFMGAFTALYGIIITLVFNNLIIHIQDLFYVLLSYFLTGLSYSIGELPNSFIKRQLNISPGDQSKSPYWRFIFSFLDIFDSLIFVGITYYVLFKFSAGSVIVSVLIGGMLHMITDQFMIRINLKKKKDNQGINKRNSEIIKSIS